MARQFRVGYPGALYDLSARSNDQQPIVHDETDRTDFLTRLGQEILPQRRRSAKSSNEVPRRGTCPIHLVYAWSQRAALHTAWGLSHTPLPRLKVLSTMPRDREKFPANGRLRPRCYRYRAK